MKLTKMSLVAALLVAGTSAFAIDNVKVSGDAKLYYQTSDAKSNYASLTNKDSLFGKDNSSADTAVDLAITADLVKNDTVKVSGGAAYTFISTLGLENVFVSNVWAGSHTATYDNGDGGYPAKVNNANWMTEAWIAATAGKTTVKLGRMELDTPLAFTEKWSIEKNTFEAAVAINQDIPDTTLVGAYVGNGNGSQDGKIGTDIPGLTRAPLATGAVVNDNGGFTTFGLNGAFAVGAINNSIKPLTVQAWYYQFPSLATAYWLEADLNMEGILAGAQYTSGKIDKAYGNGKSSGTYALMLGYEMKDMLTIKAAYSETDKDGELNGANTATSSGASKLYTEAWWNYGKVTGADTQAFNISVESPVNGLFDLGLYYTNANQASKKVAGVEQQNNDLSEFTVTAGKSFGPLDATLAYIYADVEDNNNATDDKSNTIQAYLTLNF